MLLKESLLGLLVLWNFAVFIIYGVDKYKAVHQQWRIPEKVLLTIALLGAGFGAYLGGKIWHHKTRKDYFVLTWCVGMVVEIVVIYWVLTNLA